MSNPVDLALVSLLPHVSYPPDELQSLANSLLTQSRARAPRLKADEEVARTYACAHIACERLQNRLKLEIGKDVRPPCPPRVYARLKGYLGGVLETAQEQQQQQQQRQRTRKARDEVRTTPRKTANPGGTPVSTPIIPSDVTPTAGRKRTFSQTTGGAEQGEEGLPTFTLPLLEEICTFCTNAVYVLERIRMGAMEVSKEISSRRKPESLGSTLKRRRGRATPQGTASAESPAQQNTVIPVSRWPALLAALFLCTLAKTKNCEVDAEEIGTTRKKVVKAVVTFCKKNQSTIPENFALKEDEVDKMIAFYLLEASDCGWLDMQWYLDITNIPDDEAESESEATPTKPRSKPAKTPLRRKEKHGGQGEMERGTTAAGLLPGLATMFQPAVDWLSDERRAQYEQWKDDLLDRVASIEQQS